MLPGGIELGVFPADFWLRSVTAIESVVRACVQRFNVVRDGYDARAWAFCVERLGSYVVLRRTAHLAGHRAAPVPASLGQPESLVAPIRRPAQPADGRCRRLRDRRLIVQPALVPVPRRRAAADAQGRVLACSHFLKRQAGAGPPAMNSACSRPSAESASYSRCR